MNTIGIDHNLDRKRIRKLLIIVQFKAFAEGKTPYPTYTKWFNIFTGAIPAFLISAAVGPHTALGAGVGTMFLSFGNALIFGGLLLTLPDEKTFEAFSSRLNSASIRQ